MAFPVLADIGVVPVKPGAILQRVHSRHDFQYTTIVYARRLRMLGQPLPYGLATIRAAGEWIRV